MFLPPVAVSVVAAPAPIIGLVVTTPAPIVASARRVFVFLRFRCLLLPTSGAFVFLFPWVLWPVVHARPMGCDQAFYPRSVIGHRARQLEAFLCREFLQNCIACRHEVRPGQPVGDIVGRRCPADTCQNSVFCQSVVNTLYSCADKNVRTGWNRGSVFANGTSIPFFDQV